MAFASEKVRSTAIEAQEFPDLSGRYEVSSVPKIVVNEVYDFVGGLPEPQFVDSVLSAIGKDPSDGQGVLT